jgi:hypothetical protein
MNPTATPSGLPLRSAAIDARMRGEAEVESNQDKLPRVDREWKAPGDQPEARLKMSENVSLFVVVSVISEIREKQIEV